MMGKLEELDVDQLKAALDEVTSAKGAKRLMVALAYKDGVDVDVLSDRYSIPQSTIYYWLDRFEERGIEGALEDEQRPGRPPKLTAEQRAEVESWLTDPPEGIKEWTARQLQQRIAEEFDVEYSTAHLHRQFLA
jgi:transposase